MAESKNHIKIIAFAMMVAVIIGGIISCGIWTYNYCTKCEESNYNLEKMEDGVYGYYGTIVSSIPAQNCQTITVYYGGCMRTFKGNVQVCYTDGEAKINIKDCNIANADSIVVYAPKGTIVNTGVAGIGGGR